MYHDNIVIILGAYASLNIIVRLKVDYHGQSFEENEFAA